MKLPATSLILSAVLAIVWAPSARSGALDQGPTNLSMRADALAKAFHENEFQADAKYTGKRLTLGGEVLRVGRDRELGIPYVVLRGVGGLSVKCVFPTSETGRLLQLRPKSLVGINGTLAGKLSENTGYIILQDCRM